MRFADIPGQEETKRRLREMVDHGHVPHALLLEGPQGVGKFALIRATAQYIHCTDRTPDGDSCGRCPACVQHQSFNHIDVMYSFPVLKKNSKPTISNDYAEEFRDFMQESPMMDFEQWLPRLGNVNGQPAIYVDEANELLRRLNLKARQSRYKIVLMWLPERLNPDTANKLLKLVEEPYDDTIFLMASDNPRGILPTIYSRTQRIAVPRYSEAEITDTLVRETGIDRQAAADAAALAEGSMVTAYHLAGLNKERQRYLDLFMQLMRLAWQRKVLDLRAWSLDVAALGRESAIRFYDYCSRMIRENFIYNIGDDRLVALTPAERQFSSRFSPFVNEKNVEDIAMVLDAARNDITLNGNAKIIAFDLAVKMILLLKR
ncbi:MAG: DNA polymerase III subunit delta [Bacteroidales bacterium]|nr:DNA polymerase III subunit delta [Bacteroidales bacterium]